MWTVPLGSGKSKDALVHPRQPITSDPKATNAPQQPQQPQDDEAHPTGHSKHLYVSKVVNDFLVNEDGVSMAQRRNAVLSAQLLLKNLTTAHEIENLQRQWRGKLGVRLSQVEFYNVLKPVVIRGGHFDTTGQRIIHPGQEESEEDIIAKTTQSKLQCRQRRSDLDNYIHDLFFTMDKDRNGTISWDEFVSFVIDDVIHDSQSAVFSNRNSDDSQYVYRGHCTVRDPSIRVSLTETREWYSRLYYFDQLDRVVSVWRNKVIIASPQSLNNTLHQHHMIAEHRSDVFCCEYADSSSILITATREKKPLCIWTAGVNVMVLRNQLEFDIPVSEDEAWINVMRHTTRVGDNKRGILLCGTRSGLLHQIDLQKKHKDWSLRTLLSTPVHKGSLTDLLVLPSNGNIVTCGVDSKVCIINTFHDSHPVITDMVGHKRGVYSLSYTSEYNFIVSGGYEGFALAWVANMGTSPAFRLEDISSPNEFPLISVKCLPNSPHIVTLDNHGTYRLFDVRMVRLVEAWRLTESCDRGHYGTNPVQGNECIASFCYTGSSHRQLVCGGRRLYVYDHHAKATESPRLAHNTKESIVAAAYSEASNEFVTATASYVTLWSGTTGSPKCSHYNLTHSVAITKIIVDGSAGKFLLGLTSGDVTAHVLATGVQIRRYVKHDKAISSIVVDAHKHLLYTASIDGLLCIWQDRDSGAQTTETTPMSSPPPPPKDKRTKYQRETAEEPEELVMVTNPEVRIQHDQSIRQIIVQPKKGVCAIIPKKQCFYVYSLDKFPKVHRTHRVLLHGNEVILTACFIGDLPQICLVDSTGMLQLWMLKSAEDDAHIIRKWFNYTPYWTHHVLDKKAIQHCIEDDQEVPSRIVPTVNCVTFDPVKNLLVTGDDRGFVVIWNVTTQWMQYTKCGVPARIHAFEVHSHPIVSLQALAGPVHCLLTAAANNSVFLTFFDGHQFAALRQGPLVERYWNFTEHEEHIRRCNARLRWYAIRNLGAKAVVASRNVDKPKLAFSRPTKEQKKEEVQQVEPLVAVDPSQASGKGKMSIAELRRIMDRKAVPKVIFRKSDEEAMAMLPTYRTPDEFKRELHERVETSQQQLLELGTQYKKLRSFQELMQKDEILDKAVEDALEGVIDRLPQSFRAPTDSAVPRSILEKFASAKKSLKKEETPLRKNPSPKRKVSMSSKGICVGGVVGLPPSDASSKRSHTDFKIRKPESLLPAQLVRPLTPPTGPDTCLKVQAANVVPSERLHNLSTLKKGRDEEPSQLLDLKRILQLCEENTSSPRKGHVLFTDKTDVERLSPKPLESVLSVGVSKNNKQAEGGGTMTLGGSLHSGPLIGLRKKSKVWEERSQKEPSSSSPLPKLVLHGSNAPSTYLSGYRKASTL